VGEEIASHFLLSKRPRKGKQGIGKEYPFGKSLFPSEGDAAPQDEEHFPPVLGETPPLTEGGEWVLGCAGSGEGEVNEGGGQESTHSYNSRGGTGSTFHLVGKRKGTCLASCKEGRYMSGVTSDSLSKKMEIICDKLPKPDEGILKE